MSFNRLTSAEAELLALLSEECGEVVQIIGKILRHGLESTHPNGGPTNRQMLEKECGDVWAAMDLCANKITEPSEIAAHRQMKLRKVFEYLHHNKPAEQTP